MANYLITLTSPIALRTADGTVMANVVEGYYQGEGELIQLTVYAYYIARTELMERLPKLITVRVKRTNIRCEQAVCNG